MNIRAFLRHLALVLPIMPAWSISAFSGEIHDAVKQGDLAKVKALPKDNPELIFSKDDNAYRQKTQHIFK